MFALKDAFVVSITAPKALEEKLVASEHIC
jgi:hypothetical protein